MAENATITPPETSKQASPSVDDLASQFNAPSYQGGDAGDNQQNLAGSRNKARLQQTKDEASSDPLNPQSSAIPQSNRQPGYVGQGANPNTSLGQLPGGGASASGPQEAGQNQEGSSESKNPLRTTQKNSNATPQEKQSQLNGDRAETRNQKESKQKKSKRAEIEKNYPHPISFTTFMVIGTTAVAVDITTLIIMFTGLGEIPGWIIGVIFSGIYWVFIYRVAPKDPFIKKKLNIRTITNFIIEWVPFLGSLWVGNTLVVIYSYIIIQSYESGRLTPGPSKATTSIAAGKLPR